MQTTDFKSVKPSRAYKKIAKQIKNSILERNLKPVIKVPVERELSKSIGVGRLSLAEELHILELIGILETKYGLRHFIAENAGALVEKR